MSNLWDQPRPLLLTPEEIAVWRAYDAARQPSPVVRERILAAVRDLPVLPAAEEAEEDEAECVTCEDSGEIHAGVWGFPMPCPDCGLSDSWNNWTELADDARRGK